MRSLSRNPVTCPCTFASVIGALLPVLKKKNTIFQLDYNYLNKLTGSQVEEFVIEGCVFWKKTFSTYVQYPQKKDKRLLVSLLT